MKKLLSTTCIALALYSSAFAKDLEPLKVFYTHYSGECSSELKELFREQGGFELTFQPILVKDKYVYYELQTKPPESDIQIAEEIPLYTEGLSNAEGYMSAKSTTMTINDNKQKLSQVWLLFTNDHLGAGLFLGDNKECGVQNETTAVAQHS